MSVRLFGMSPPAGQPAAEPPTENAKKTLRRTLLTARRAADLGPDADTRRCAALLAVPEVATARVVTGYVALPGEPDIAAALAALRRRGVQVLLPAVTESRDLDFVDHDGVLVAAAEVDVVLAPAVAADRSGHRLGRGGGSYDRALTRVRPDALVIAVVHPNELVDAVPFEPHDRPVGAVLAGDEFMRVAE
jgi:5-formyltetrahydrofolate cyclo-ligase